jgi:hypothetical protein
MLDKLSQSVQNFPAHLRLSLPACLESHLLTYGHGMVSTAHGSLPPSFLTSDILLKKTISEGHLLDLELEF